VSDDLAVVALLTEPARKRVFDAVLAAGGAADRDGIAAAAGVSRKLAAFHLDRLAEAGLLAATYRRTGTAGRPRKFYSPTDRELAVSIPRREYELMAELFAEALDTGKGRSRGQVSRVAAAVGARMAKAEIHKRPSSNRALLALLARHGYQPVTRGGEIQLSNCPFHALSATHRQLTCTANHALLTGMLGELGAQGYEAVSVPKNGGCCVLIRRPGYRSPDRRWRPPSVA